MSPRKTAARPEKRRGGSKTKKRRRGGSPAPPVDDPVRYVVRVSRRTGEEIPGPIPPEELLIHAHRDRHPVEFAAEFVASRLIQLTGRDDGVRRALRGLNHLGEAAAAGAGFVLGSERVERAAKRLMGVVDSRSRFQFREPASLSESEVRSRIEALQDDARRALRALGRKPRFRLLLTGATGFLGQELVAQAARDPRVERVVAVLRPEIVRDRRSGEVIEEIPPEERGRRLLKRLHVPKAAARKFEFVAGDIERPRLGLAASVVAELQADLTHTVHCSASVAFDDPYPESFRANVLGCRNALDLSLKLQRAPGSRFVHHVTIETSYIHGRKKRTLAQEGRLAFPRDFYNNYYELTKAMASIETDRYMVEHGLRVAQLLPSIVVGHWRTGNNRGDTKVVNAPINAFGRARVALDEAREKGRVDHGRAWLAVMLASGFPGDRSAELNLVPVDRVAEGIRAALGVPEAIGARIHLATDNRIRAEDMVRIAREELGATVRLADPTLYRNLTLPVVVRLLEALGEPRLAAGIGKLGTIFGGYNEWGQPIHEIGNDVRILGLPIRRPNTLYAVRMLCRHNRYVQAYGRIRDPKEIARREAVWEKAVDAIEDLTGQEAGAIRAARFPRLLRGVLDLESFELRSG